MSTTSSLRVTPNYADAVFKSRWFAVALLIAFGLSIAFWVTRSWTDTKPLAPPPGVRQQNPDTVKFQCPPPWGSGSIVGPKTTVRPVVGTPCDQRSARRNLVFADLAIAGIGLAFVSTRRRTHDSDAQPLLVTPPVAG